MITRALASIGIAGISQALRNGEPLNFPSPVREDGPGRRFEVDLSYGVTATQVIERREQFASGLRRPRCAVWPEVVNAGRPCGTRFHATIWNISAADGQKL